MTSKKKVLQVLGPDGRPMTLSDLPKAGYRGRWVPRRKEQVVTAVRGGLLTREEAMVKWGLSDKEWAEWEVNYKRFGRGGLMPSHLQERPDRQ